MRLIFCGGGTGGHVYPALTVAATLRRLFEDRPPEMLYLGVRGRLDAELVTREGLPFQGITARPLRVGSVSGAARGLLSLTRGTIESYRALARFRPDAVFATGGYGSVPVCLAARLRSLPFLLFEPGPEMGLAVRLLVHLADRIAVSIPPALEAMPRHKTTLTGYPVRPPFFEARRDPARTRLGLRLDLPAVLVSGASSGAAALNSAVAAWAPSLLRRAQLVHVCGHNDYARLASGREALEEPLRERYQLFAYLHEEMPLAMAAADLAVMRAGASTLGELPATRLPAVLIPGEYEGWDQSPNARYLQSEGAAIMLPQSRLSELPGLVDSLLADSQRLQSMRDNLARLARPNAAERLARLLVAVAQSRSGRAETDPGQGVEGAQSQPAGRGGRRRD